MCVSITSKRVNSDPCSICQGISDACNLLAVFDHGRVANAQLAGRLAHAVAFQEQVENLPLHARKTHPDLLGQVVGHELAPEVRRMIMMGLVQ